MYDFVFYKEGFSFQNSVTTDLMHVVCLSSVLNQIVNSRVEPPHTYDGIVSCNCRKRERVGSRTDGRVTSLGITQLRSSTVRRQSMFRDKVSKSGWPEVTTYVAHGMQFVQLFVEDRSINGIVVTITGFQGLQKVLKAISRIKQSMQGEFRTQCAVNTLITIFH